jgi:hypothetical protein
MVQPLAFLLISMGLLAPTAAAAADGPCAGVSGPCFWFDGLIQRPDGSAVAELRGQGFAPDANVELEIFLFGVWVEIPVVDGFPPDTDRNGSFKAQSPRGFSGVVTTPGEYRLNTTPASSREAHLQVLDVQCPDRPGRCTIEQIAN